MTKIHKLIQSRVDQALNGFFKMSIDNQKVILRFILKQISNKILLNIIKSSSNFKKQLPDKTKRRSKKLSPTEKKKFLARLNKGRIEAGLKPIRAKNG